MLKFFKTDRGNGRDRRGYFSYMTESIIDIHNLMLLHPNEKYKLYYDISNIFGYGEKNIYDVCFVQDEVDFLENRYQYSNIESVTRLSKLYCYDISTFNENDLKMCELIIKNYFILNEKMQELFLLRHSQIDFTKTIGFHRRSTDMYRSHGFPSVDLSNLFSMLENEDFENIFLMCDNLIDLNKIKKRYGNRLITFDEFSSSKVEENPFFMLTNDEQSIENHIKEIVFGAFTLGMTKKLFCTKSNLSMFSILSNSNLNYMILN